MKIKDIIATLNKRSTNPSIRFEEILRTIFLQAVKDEGKIIRWNEKYGNSLQFDFSLGNGIGDYKKQIFVEVKYFKEKKIPLINKSLDNLFSPYKNIVYYRGSSRFSLSYFMLILPFNLTDKEKQSVVDHFKTLTNKFEIIIWGLNELEPYFEKYAEYITKLVPELSEQALKNIVEKSIEKTESPPEINSEQHIKNLTRAYKKDDLVLFLGAGVSITAGLPSWDALLSKLLLNIIESKLKELPDLNENQKEKIANSLKELNSSSPIQAARYINSGLSENFEKQVSDILYKDLKNKESTLIKAISKLCTAPRGAFGVKAITNYNFDDLIEDSLNSVGVKCKPIFNDNSFPEKSELGIYHVHGFLPRNPEIHEGIRDSLLIFSEKNYHTIMQDPYNWSNLTQLNFFRENTCLFIGQSGTDPNLRRLLEMAKERTKISKHYIVLKRTQKDIFEKNMKKDIPDERTISTIIEIHQKLQELSFDEIGLNVLWVDDYDEIDELILNIKN